MEEKISDHAIPLTEVIDQLRQEIHRASGRADTAGEALRFQLDRVQLELEVAVTRTAEGGTQAKFWVLEFGAKGTRERSRTQKVVLELTPRRSDGEVAAEGGREDDVVASGIFLGAPVGANEP